MSPIKLLLLRNQSYKQLEIMYFAQSIEEHRIEVFKILLFRTLDGYDGYRDEISKVVVDCAKVIILLVTCAKIDMLYDINLPYVTSYV